MKTDIVVQRAKEIIKDLDLTKRIENIKQYRTGLYKERYTENEIKRFILDYAENDKEQNYLFVNKIIKQINIMLL